eukprot:scpid36885/ scgid26415/ 
MAARIEGFLRPYRGKGDSWEVFWAKFAFLATNQKWDSDDKKMAQLPLYLDGDAFMVYNAMDDADQKKPDEVEKRMKEAFCLTKSQAYKLFVARRLQLDESPDGYIADLRRLAAVAGLGRGADADSVLVEQILNGLPSSMAQQVRLALVGKGDDVSLCLQLVRALQQTGTEDDVVSAASGASGPGPAGSGTRNVLCFRCNKLGHVRRNCPEAKSGYDRGAWRSSAAGGSSGVRPGLTCFFCDKPGHLKADCEERRAWEAQRSSKVTGQPSPSAACTSSPQECSVERGEPAEERCLYMGHGSEKSGQLVKIFVGVSAASGDNAGKESSIVSARARGQAVVDTGSTRTLISRAFADRSSLTYDGPDTLETNLVALDGNRIEVLGHLEVLLERNDGPVNLPRVKVRALVVESLSTVRADVLIGADVASRSGGLQLKYSSDGQLCGVVFGAAASD